MALINPNTNEYLRIKSINIDTDYVCSVYYTIYASKEQRLNPQDYPMLLIRDNLHLNSGALQVALSNKADASLSMIDNLKKAAYIAIHNDNFEFSGWEDDI